MAIFDDKELNIEVKFEDLISHVERKGRAYVYLKTDNQFELIIFSMWETWDSSHVKNWIKEHRLFRRRNRPFESMMA